MKLTPFDLTLRPDGQVELPDAILELIRSKGTLHAVAVGAESEDDAAAADAQDEADWKRWGMEQFLKGYDDADAIYDLL